MSLTAPHFSTSALITVDVQNDFTLDGAPAQFSGTLEVLPNIKALLEIYRKCHLPIVHIVRLYRKDGSNVDPCRRQMVLDGAEVVAPGSAGAQLADAIQPAGAPPLDADLLLDRGIQEIGAKEYVIYKPRWGAFFATPLEKFLRSLGIDTLTFCGCNFPNCPRTSIYEASERDFRVALAVDAVSLIYDRGIGELMNIGVACTPVREIVAHITDVCTDP